MAWYAVYTRPHYEAKLAQTLAHKKIDCFCPYTRSFNSRSRKNARVPLFPSFVFIQTTEKQLKTVRSISGIVNVVYWLDKPVVIRDADMAALADFTARYANIQVEKIPVAPMEMTDLVHQKRVEASADQRDPLRSVVKLLLPTLGFALRAEPVPVAPEFMSHQLLHKKPGNGYQYTFLYKQ